MGAVEPTQKDAAAISGPAGSQEDKPLRTTQDIQAIHASRHLLPFEDHRLLKSQDARVLVKGDGLQVWDNDGKRFLDAMSGLWCVTLGYNNPALIQAATRQMETLSYCSQFFNTTNPTIAELSDKLFQILPPDYARVLYTNSGSEANETLIRVVRRFWQLADKPEKKLFIGRENGYHGSTTATVALGGMKAMHDMGGLSFHDARHIPEPFYFAYRGDMTEAEFGIHCAQMLEAKIIECGAENIAAFIAEPFQGAGGMIFPPSTYWPEIQRICLKYDILLCADEVIGGFGRLGEWFAFQYFGFEPDTITIAKGLTSGYVPMGGLVLSDRIASALAYDGGVFAHGLTYQGHPTGAAVAVATLAELIDNDILGRVKQAIGPYFQQRLRDVLGDHLIVGDIQGAGMIAAVQLTFDKVTKERFTHEWSVGSFCAHRAAHYGLIVRTMMARIILAPSFVATEAEIDEIVDKLKLAIDDTCRALEMME